MIARQGTEKHQTETASKPGADLDAVGVYLQQMAEVPLMDRKGELAAVREIERCRGAFRRQLLNSGFVLDRLLELYREVLYGKRRIDHFFGLGVADKLARKRMRAALETNVPTLERLIRLNDEKSSSSSMRPKPRMWKRRARRGRKARLLAQELEPRMQCLCSLMDGLVQLLEQIEAAIARRNQGQPSDGTDLQTLVCAAREDPDKLRKRVRRLLFLRHQYEVSRQVLVAGNLRLVVSIARHFQKSGLSFLDVIQEGNSGLLHAADKFDYRRGFRFSTYATWWIQQAIRQAIGSQAHLVRLPVNQLNNLRRILQAQEKVSHAGRAVTAEEVAHTTGLRREEAALVMRTILPIVSLDGPANESMDDPLREVIQDHRVDFPLATLEQNDRQRQIKTMLKSLNRIEQQVVSLSFGLRSGKSHTLSEIGAVVHLNRESVRQIRDRALTKIRVSVVEACNEGAKCGRLLAELAEDFPPMSVVG